MRLAGLLILFATFTGTAAESATSEDRSALLEQRREKLKEKWEAQFRAADADGSGSLTLAEATAAKLPDSLLNHFAEIDADRNGGLTPEELWTVHEKRLQQQRRPAGPPR
jgi:Ca2+-binding EF-hand superfamily protein